MESELVIETVVGRRRLYRLNREHPFATALLELFRVERERRDALATTVTRWAEQHHDAVAAAWLFGSVARQEDRLSSDVDIALVVRENAQREGSSRRTPQLAEPRGPTLLPPPKRDRLQCRRCGGHAGVGSRHVAAARARCDAAVWAGTDGASRSPSGLPSSDRAARSLTATRTGAGRMAGLAHPGQVNYPGHDI